MDGPAFLPHIGLVLTPQGYTLTASSGTYSLTGNDASLTYSGARGAPGPLPHIALLLQTASGTGLAAGQGSYTITGNAATFPRTYILTGDQGAYSLTGQIVALDKSSPGIEAPAPFPWLAGLLAPVTVGRTLTADPGIYAIIGSDALIDYEVTASQGGYTLTGNPAALTAAFILNAAQGSYAVTGNDVAFTRTGAALTMAADFGAYAVSGFSAGLTGGYQVDAAQGFYGLGGQQATLALGPTNNYTLDAASGSYVVTGSDAPLAYLGLTLEAGRGLYLVTGYPATRAEAVRITLNFSTGPLFRIGAATGDFSRAAATAKSWLPPPREPMLNPDGTMRPSWYRFLHHIAEVRLAGINGPTMVEVAQNVTEAKALVTNNSVEIAAVASQTTANAEALAVAVEVAQTNDLSGADQIPEVVRRAPIKSYNDIL